MSNRDGKVEHVVPFDEEKLFLQTGANNSDAQNKGAERNLRVDEGLRRVAEDEHVEDLGAVGETGGGGLKKPGVRGKTLAVVGMGEFGG